MKDDTISPQADSMQRRGVLRAGLLMGGAALAPGFTQDPGRFSLAVELTRITFPYLLLMTLVTLYSGILNARERFAAAAAAPILLNVTMVAALACAWFFPSAGHAAAWGVLVAGCLELLLVTGDAARVRATVICSSTSR